MNCDSCKSGRVVEITSKCSDCFHATIGEKEHDGYVPYDIGIGGGDYVEFSYCLDCGKIQGTFPLEQSKIEDNAAEDT